MLRRSSSSVQVFYPKLSRTELLQTLSKRLPKLAAALPLARVVLFGSYAKGNYTVGSDVDLLILYHGEPRPDAYAMTRKILAVSRLEPHLYTVAEYERLRDTLDRMSSGGIPLFPKEGKTRNSQLPV